MQDPEDVPPMQLPYSHRTPLLHAHTFSACSSSVILYLAMHDIITWCKFEEKSHTPSEDLSVQSPLWQPCGASHGQQHAAHAVNPDPEHLARLLGPHPEWSRHISDAYQRLQSDWLEIRKTSKTYLSFVFSSPPNHHHCPFFTPAAS